MSRRPPSLAARLRSTLAVVAVLQLLVVGLALGLFTSMRAEQDRITGAFFSTIQDSNAAFARVLQVEEAAVSYLRGGDPDDLARLRTAQQPRDDAVPAEVLRERLAEVPEAVAALDRTVTVAQEWLALLQGLVAEVESGGAGALTAAQRQQQRAAFAELQSAYDAYLTEVLAARAAARERLETRTSLLLGAVLLAVGTSVAAGVVLHTALRRWVTRPVGALAAETRAVRVGALDHEVHVDGPPEIEELAGDVEAMRRALVDQLGELRRAQEQLEQSAEELRRSNRDLEQFAYVASHDLQEPLRKVSSFCQMLERRYHGQLDERADQYIAFAVDGAKRMQLLINDLLAFSRVGRISDGFTDVAMDQVLADALRNLAGALEDSGGVVTADPLPVVPGERRLLVQLLQNLVGNALKFRGDEPPRVRVTAERDGELWRFAVSDNGIGIAPQYAERIFVIFQRLHPKAEYEGTGIGLALCKRIVEHHGGTIDLDPHAGPGATFRFTLPVTAPADQQRAPEGAEKEPAWTPT